MKLTENLYYYHEKGMMDSNTYVIRSDLSIIIDPGLTQFLPALVQDLHQDGIVPEDIGIIANTHLHADHYGANEAFREISGAEIAIHPVQKKFYDIDVNKVPKFFGFQAVAFKEDICLDNDGLNTGKIEIEFIHSPGHSPDSICFYCREKRILVCGDVIFSENTGRVDLPGGDAGELKHSIKELSQLQIEYLLPGHMDVVTGAAEVKSNFEFVEKHVFRWL